MAAVPPPPTDFPPASPRGRPWRVIAVALFAIALILASIAAYLYVANRIEPSTWALAATQVTDLQARGLDGTGVRVCIVDSGVDLSHPELQGVRLIAWHDFTNAPSPATPYDDAGHGTAMAGIIFAQGILRGVAPKAGLIAVKAITSSGTGTDKAIADAIDFCLAPNGDLSLVADVVSMSLGGANHAFLGSQTVNAVIRALSDGVYVVAAAGNDGGPSDDGDVESPASQPGVIAVGAVDRQGVIASFSSIGSATWGLPPVGRTDPDQKPEVVSPGVVIMAPLNGGRYDYVSGTSPSAALMSGIVALVLQDHPGYVRNPSAHPAFKTALMESAVPEVGQQLPHDPHYGYGLVQAASWHDRL